MYEYVEYFCSCRPDGTDFYLISSPFLHMFDQTMSMLPFATRTDIFEAIKNADAKASDVDAFLDTLLAEHDAVGALGQSVNSSLKMTGRHSTPVRGKGCGRRAEVFVTGPLPRRIARMRTVVPLDALHAKHCPRGMADSH
jgi:hypothetical protein